MPVPSAPPPIAQLGRRSFSFYPAILNVEQNEWIYQSATWSEVIIRNAKTAETVSISRRYLGDISLIDAPVVIVGLLKELEYQRGAIRPAERRVIEMPLAVNDSPRVRTSRPAAQVVGIRLEDAPVSRFRKPMLAGVALGLAGCVLVISLYRGGLIAARVSYAPAMQGELPFSSQDDYSTIVRAIGRPSRDRWRPDSSGLQYRLLVYPQRGLYVILMGRDRSDARYIGSLDWNWHPIHAVELPGQGSSYATLQALRRF